MPVVEKNPKIDPKKKDPICGMQGTIPKYDHYFCSQKCIEEYEDKHNLNPHRKLNKTMSFILGFVVSIALLWGLQQSGFMRIFMGIALLALAGLQLIDLKGYATAFANYDIIAAKSRVYGLAFPFIELALGLAFLFSYLITASAIVLIIIFGIGTIGVTKNLLSKNPVKCACLGTKLPVPLTKFTFFEDIVMVAMGVMILLGV